MIKKQQKWIASFVAVTFIWLMQVSTMPVAAAGTTEQIGSANAEKAPGFIEESGPSGHKAKKKSPLPFILIGVGVLTIAIVAVLFLFVLKGYDIRGSWSGTMTVTGVGSFTAHVVYSGKKKSGTLLFSDPGVTNTPGTYSVDGKNVTFTFESNGQTINATGAFTGKDTMSGTWVNVDATNWGGNWNYTRAAGSAQQMIIQNIGGGISVIKR